MKKTRLVSIILCVAMLLGCFAVAPLGASEPLELCVVSDTHFKHASIDLTENSVSEDAPLYSRAGISGQLDYESVAIIKSFSEAFLASETKTLLICGDLTDGKVVNHREFAGLLSSLEKQGKKVFVINGNHDVEPESDSGNASAEDFARIYADFGYNEALSRDGGSLSYTADLGNGYRLLAIDSCIHGEDNGEIPDDTVEWIENELSNAKADGDEPVVMMHHSLLPHMSCYSLTSMQVKNSSDLTDILTNNGAKLVFTGHFHANDITVTQNGNGKKIYDIMTNSLITYPNSYRNITISPSGASVSTSFIESVDINDLPDCFSQKELSAISSDFTAYSKSFFFAGIENWINSYLGTTRKIGKLLKIEKGSALDNKLNKMMPYISQALTMNIYGEENSLQAIAALAGKRIPESEYNSLAEIAATVLSGVYHGDETIGQDSVEVKVLFSGLHAALTYASIGMAGRLKDTQKLTETSELMYALSDADELMMGVFSPILDGITGDAYEPSDLNVELDFSDAGKLDAVGAPTTFFSYIVWLFKKFFALFDIPF